jgi:hypothetical protein
LKDGERIATINDRELGDVKVIVSERRWDNGEERFYCTVAEGPYKGRSFLVAPNLLSNWSKPNAVVPRSKSQRRKERAQRLRKRLEAEAKREASQRAEKPSQTVSRPGAETSLGDSYAERMALGAIGDGGTLPT